MGMDRPRVLLAAVIFSVGGRPFPTTLRSCGEAVGYSGLFDHATPSLVDPDLADRDVRRHGVGQVAYVGGLRRRDDRSHDSATRAAVCSAEGIWQCWRAYRRRALPGCGGNVFAWCDLAAVATPDWSSED